MLDAVNQLLNPVDHNLWWLPSFLPQGVNVIVSSLSGVAVIVVKEASAHGWESVKISPLVEDEKRKLIFERLKLYGKTLTVDHVERLISHHLSPNPLFLTTVVLELCTIGIFKKLEEQLKRFLESTDMPFLFGTVIERWEEDFGPSNISKMLSVLAVSRRGLAEDELKELTEMNPLEWSKAISAVRSMLSINRGLLNFSHDFLKQAIIQKYGVGGSNSVSEAETRQSLIKYFERKQQQIGNFTERIAEELPWQLMRLVQQQQPSSGTQEKWSESLISLISNVYHLSVFLQNQMLKFDLIQYWKAIGHSRDSIQERYLNETSNLRKEARFSIHERTGCDGCNLFPIVGTCFKCSICHPDYDLCEKCEHKRPEVHDVSHPMFSISQDYGRLCPLLDDVQKTLNILCCFEGACHLQEEVLSMEKYWEIIILMLQHLSTILLYC